MTKAEVESILGVPDDFEEAAKIMSDRFQNPASGTTKRMMKMKTVVFRREGTVSSAANGGCASWIRFGVGWILSGQ
jgi:hypothetical protein